MNEDRLHAYIDDQVSEAERLEIEAELSRDPEAAARVSDYQRQNEALHSLLDPILDQPHALGIGARRRIRWQRWGGLAAAIAVGFIGGYLARGDLDLLDGPDLNPIARQAMLAHAAYVPEVRHPVEVGAEQEAHLVAWLSKRLGAPLKVPYLGEQGYQLVGGRLLPGERGPVAQFMYQDSKGQRLTLYVRTNPDESGATAFRYTGEHGVSVFYWLDRKLGYALSGQVDKDELLRLATAVHRQLNP